MDHDSDYRHERITNAEPSASLTDLARMQAQRNLFKAIHEQNAAKDPKHKDFHGEPHPCMRCGLALTPPHRGAAGGTTGDADAAGDGQGDSEE